MNNYLLLELSKYNHWVVWNKAANDKAPLRGTDGFGASPTNRADWCDFQTAHKYTIEHQGFALGFVLTKDCGLTCIDLDYSEDPAIVAEQTNIFNQFNITYSERSPSGKGAHIWCKGFADSRKFTEYKIEVYSDARYMTVTGDAVRNVPVVDCQPLLDQLIVSIDMAKGRTASVHTSVESQPETKTDQELIETAANAANGTKFKELWEGRWQQYYKSQSEADFALVNIIAFYTDNKQQVVRLFHLSQLGKRPKAKRQDYLQGIISKAFDKKVDSATLANAKAIGTKEWSTVEQGVPLSTLPFNLQTAKGIKLIHGPDIEDIPQEWIISDIIPDKTLTGIYGMSGIGKTTFAVGLAVHLSKCGHVLILTNEDGPSHIRSMFKTMKGNISNLYVEDSATEDMPWLLNDCVSVEKTLIEMKPKIVVIDSFYSHTPSKTDSNKHDDVAPLLVPLRKLANKYCPFLLIHHDNKSRAGSPMQKAGGSHGIVATIRHNVRVTQHAENADMRVVTVFNSNVGKTNVPALQFQLNPFTWSSERVNITAEEAIQQAEPIQYVSQTNNMKTMAMSFLAKEVSDGPKLAKELIERAETLLQINYATLNRARVALGIESNKNPDGVNVWSYPQKT
jgi:hypothetical protein